MQHQKCTIWTIVRNPSGVRQESVRSPGRPPLPSPPGRRRNFPLVGRSRSLLARSGPAAGPGAGCRLLAADYWRFLEMSCDFLRFFIPVRPGCRARCRLPAAGPAIWDSRIPVFRYFRMPLNPTP